jgi:hypothetical protein
MGVSDQGNEIIRSGGAIDWPQPTNWIEDASWMARPCGSARPWVGRLVVRAPGGPASRTAGPFGRRHIPSPFGSSI